MAVAACCFALVHNLHEVPPMSGHLCRQDNHSLHKWAASTQRIASPTHHDTGVREPNTPYRNLLQSLKLPGRTPGFDVA